MTKKYKMKNLPDNTTRKLIQCARAKGTDSYPAHAEALARKPGLVSHPDPEVRLAISKILAAQRALADMLVSKYELEGRVTSCEACGEPKLLDETCSQCENAAEQEAFWSAEAEKFAVTIDPPSAWSEQDSKSLTEFAVVKPQNYPDVSVNKTKITAVNLDGDLQGDYLTRYNK